MGSGHVEGRQMEDITDHWVKIRSAIWESATSTENVKLKINFKRLRDDYDSLFVELRDLKKKNARLRCDLDYARAEDPMARSVDSVRHHAAQQRIRQLEATNDKLRRKVNCLL